MRSLRASLPLTPWSLARRSTTWHAFNAEAFFDQVSRNGKTFIADKNGMRGLLGHKKAAIFVAACGASGSGDIWFMFRQLHDFQPVFAGLDDCQAV